MENYRIFLSSPSDVFTERDRVEKIVGKLNAERVDHPKLELVRWKLEYYRADATFQAQIPKPSECQLVVCIFWKRLGTDLPEAYVRTDGTTPTGTEYEFEEALTAAAARPEKLPDVLVYRKTAEVQFSLDKLELPKDDRNLIVSWASGSAGSATRRASSSPAFNRSRMPTTSRRCSSAICAPGCAIARPTSVMQGSPYRGLEPFDVEHAPKVVEQESRLIRLEDLESRSPPPHNMPEPCPPTKLSAGRDGTEDITPEDFLGHDRGPQDRAGLFALAAVDEVATLVCPDAMVFVDRVPGPEGEIRTRGAAARGFQ
jgi:hypothetical protein